MYLFVTLRQDTLYSKDFFYKYQSHKARDFGYEIKFNFRYFLYLFLMDRGVQALSLYRISNYLLKRNFFSLSQIVHYFSTLLTNVDISPYANISQSVEIWHGLGVVIGRNSQIGSRVVICQQVTMGSGKPKIGDDVFIGAGVKILGDIIIGNNVKIGANAVILEDVPDNCTVAGIPAKIVKFRS